MNRFWQIYPVFVFLFIFTEFFHPITAFSQDLGRHLKMGEIILQSKTIPTTNLFSYTYPNFPFINHHWGSEVIFYMTTHYLGLPWLLIFTSALTASAFVLVLFCHSERSEESSKDSGFKIQDLREEDPSALPQDDNTTYQIPARNASHAIAGGLDTRYLILFFAAFLYSGILLERTDLRPEIFSFFFLSCFMWILWNNRNNVIVSSEAIAKNTIAASGVKLLPRPTIHYLTPPLLLLPILELFWVNMHIYFIIGPLVIGLFLIDEIVSSYRSSKRSEPKTVNTSRFVLPWRTHSKNKIVPYEILNTKYFILFFVFLLTCLATLVNPSGLAGALYPLHIFSNYGYTIEENQSVFFLLNYGISSPTYLFFMFSVLILGSLLLISWKKTRLIDWLLYIVFAVAGFSAVRNFPLFVFATMPSFVYFLTNLFSSLSERSESKGFEHKPSTSSGKKITYVLIAPSLLLLIVNSYFFIQKNGAGYAVSNEPSAAVNFLKTEHLNGPIFNNFDIGSYLDYQLFPTERVFVDGRPEAYPASFFQNTYIPMQENPAIFQQVENKYHFETIFFAHTDQTPWASMFLQAIFQNPQWKLVYLDQQIAIFVKDDALNKALIAKHEITQKNFSINSLHAASVNDYLYLDRIFSLAKWADPKIHVLQAAATSYPDNCTFLAELINTASPSLQPIYLQKYQALCK